MENMVIKRKTSLELFLYFLIIFMLPTRSFVEILFGTSAIFVKELLLLVILIIILLKVICNKNHERIFFRSISFGKYMILYFFYLTLAFFLSVLFGNNFSNSVIGFMTSCIYILFGFVTIYFCIENERTLFYIFKILTFTLVLNFIVALTEQIAPDLLPKSIVSKEIYLVFKRSYGLTGAQLHLGVYCAIVIPMLLNLRFKTRKVVLLIGFLCITLTFSRGSWVQLLVSLFVFGVIKIKKKGFNRKIRTASFIRILFFLSAILTFLALMKEFDVAEAVFNRVGDVFNWSTETANVGRLARWKMSLEFFMHSPIFGIGLGTTGNNISRFGLPVEMKVTESYYLKLLVEQGLFGFLIFLFLLIYYIVKSYLCGKSNEVSYGICASLIGLSVELAILQSLESQIISGLFWMYLGIISYFDYQKSLKLNTNFKQSRKLYQ